MTDIETDADAATGGRDHLLTVLVSAAGTVDLHCGPAFGEEHADLATDLAAAVRRVLDAYDALDVSVDDESGP